MLCRKKLTLRDDVFFVKGAVNSCLYDLRYGNLYHLNESETGLVDRIISEPPIDGNRDDLLNSGLFSYREEVDSGDINRLKKRSPTHAFDFAWIEVTDRCNLKCRHCYQESTHVGRDMSLEDFRLCVSKLREIGIKKIQLIGGEPFILKGGLMQMLEYASGKFDYLEVFTNGTAISDNFIDFAKRNNVRLAVSIHSYLDFMHDAVTKSPGSFSKTTENLKKVATSGISYRTANIIMDGISTGNRNTSLFNVRRDKDIVRLAGRASLELLNSDLLAAKLITKKSFSKPLSRKMVIRYINGHNCFSRRLYISTQLDIYPCVMERRRSHGKLSPNKSINEVIDRQISELSKDKVQGCRACEFRYCCHDCRPDSLSKEITAKPWNCTYNPESGLWTDVETHIHSLLSEHEQRN